MGATGARGGEAAEAAQRRSMRGEGGEEGARVLARGGEVLSHSWLARGLNSWWLVRVVDREERGGDTHAWKMWM